jgi:hypothetical protein
VSLVAPAETVELEGQMSVLVQDYPQGSRKIFDLESNGAHFELHFASEPADVRTGARLRVKGIRQGGAIRVEPGPGGFSMVVEHGAGAEAAAVAGGTFGAQRTVVLLVNFQDEATQPYSKSSVQSLVFTTVNDFDLEVSYGQTWLTGDVFGYYTLAQSHTVCDYTTTASLARTAATNAGVNLSNYTRQVIIFPGNACGWWGMGTIGGIPSTAWINGDPQLLVVGHEMGHGFGLDHSHALDCHPVTIKTNCTMVEYGDTMDIMGGSSPYHFNAFQKERLGWLNDGSSPPIETVTESGTYSIDPYETTGTNPKALKIPIGTTGSYYYVEYRMAIGSDAALSSNANVVNGILVHEASASDANSSDLLDMTPATTSWSDPALDAGQSFEDSGHKITISPVSLGSTASVSVTIGSTPASRRARPVVISRPRRATVSLPGPR